MIIEKTKRFIRPRYTSCDYLSVDTKDEFPYSFPYRKQVPISIFSPFRRTAKGTFYPSNYYSSQGFQGSGLMLKIIGAGFGRTGTSSLQVALEELLGGKCYHMKEVMLKTCSPASMA